MKKLLSTKLLTQSQTDLAKTLGLNIDYIQINEFTYNISDENIKKLKEITTTVDLVFTSVNGVIAYSNLIQNHNLRISFENCFAVGKRTSEKLNELGLKSETPNRSNIISLTDLIIKKSKNTLVYFKGNLASAYLKDKVVEHNIQLIEIEAYQTLEANYEIPQTKYKGILFFSPSAVDSFFSKYNRINKDILLFAIGETTANSLKKYANNNIYTSEIQKTEEFLKFIYNTMSNQ